MNNAKKKYTWTKQSEYTHDDIKQRLIGYTKADNKNLGVLKLGMMIKYITKRDGKSLFRQGGVLTYIDPEAKYIMLKTLVNDQIPAWSVQVHNSIFFYKDRSEEKQLINDIIEKAGNIDILNKIVDIMGKNPEEIQQNVKTIYKNYNGSINSLLKKN